MMEILKTLKKLLFKKNNTKARDFIEIFRTYDKDEVLKIKQLLEKYKIPVYTISKMKNINDNNMVHSLRIPRSFEDKAKKLL